MDASPTAAVQLFARSVLEMMVDASIGRVRDAREVLAEFATAAAQINFQPPLPAAQETLLLELERAGVVY